MLTSAELTTLHDTLRDTHVLSVYLGGGEGDPAAQRSWRVRLDHAVAGLRPWLAESPPAEVAAFETCLAILESTLGEMNAGTRAPGWVAFIATNGVQAAHALPVPVPTIAIWSRGACVVPYVRALKECRPVIVAHGDARAMTVHEYRVGQLRRVGAIRAHHVIEPPMHMGTPPSRGFHPGTRGSSGREAMQAALLAGRDRMIADASRRILDLAGGDGWILVGGIGRVRDRVAEHLVAAAPGRVLAIDSLDMHASNAEIADAARAGGSTLRNAHDAARIRDIAERAGARGLGTTGADDTEWALAQSCVRDLYFTRTYRECHEADADDVVRAALNQRASVEEVSGFAATLLDEYGGLAAGLRFRPNRAPEMEAIAAGGRESTG